MASIDLRMQVMSIGMMSPDKGAVHLSAMEANGELPERYDVLTVYIPTKEAKHFHVGQYFTMSLVTSEE